MYDIVDLFRFFNSPSNFVYDSLVRYPYTFNAPMNKTINNMTSAHIILTSFQSTIYGSFGFQTSVSYTNMPTTVVNIQCGVISGSVFIQLGFSVIIVAKHFDQIMLFSDFYLSPTQKTSTNTMTLPANPTLLFYLVDCSISSADMTKYTFLQSIVLSKVPTGLSLTYTADLATTIYSLHYLAIIVDVGRIPQLPQFVLSNYGYFTASHNIFVSVNFNINVFYDTQYYNSHCFFGFTTLQNMNTALPLLRFDLSTNGIINGFQNSFLQLMSIKSFCIKDMECPILFPYRIISDRSNCYDCPTGSLIIPTTLTPNLAQTIGLCIQFDPLYVMDMFNTATGQSIQQCYTNCLTCLSTYYSSSGTCLSCSFTNCKTCNTVTCLTCISQMYYISLFTCHLCSQLAANCIKCTQTDCLLCSMNYFAVNGSCILGSSLAVFGCLSPMYQTPNAYCLLCDTKNNFIKNSSNLCQCSTGFTYNPSLSTCTQFCGDGLAYILPCDDGNNNDNDGCTNTCTVSAEFTCQIINLITFCKSYSILKFQIQSVLKNSNQNSAILTLRATNINLPFDLLTEQFTGGNTSYITISVGNGSSTTLLKSHIISVQSNLIMIYISYPITIQKHQATLTLSTQSTKYIQRNNQVIISTKLIGMNKLLIISQMAQQVKAVGFGLMVIGVLALLCFAAGIFARKFIGLQGLLTLQLAYYSQLLLSNANKWPLGFQYLSYLKYSFGYNQIVNLTQYVPYSSVQRKQYYLQMSKTIIQNYNTSFLLLILCFIAFIITVLLKKKAEHKILESRNHSKSILKQKKLSEKDQLKQAQSNLRQLQSKQHIQQILFRILSQLCTWCILQLTLCVTCRILICNQTMDILPTPVIPQKQKLLHLTQKLIASSSFFIIFFIGLNHHKNFFISDNTWGQIIKRKEEILYKGLTMGYLFLMGVIIGCEGELKIAQLSIAIVVFLIHLTYLLIVNLGIKPYKKSLKIHRYTLLINHIVYLIFLVYINIINFVDQLSQSIMVSFGYFLAGTCAIIVVLTAIRLYYEYRYGLALQVQVQKQQDLQKLKLQQQKYRIQDNLIQNYQAEAKKRQLQKGIQPKNKFSLQNQIEEQKKMEVMEFLNKRIHWTKQQKEKYYFQRFAEKPIAWLKNK